MLKRKTKKLSIFENRVKFQNQLFQEKIKNLKNEIKNKKEQKIGKEKVQKMKKKMLKEIKRKVKFDIETEFFNRTLQYYGLSKQQNQ